MAYKINSDDKTTKTLKKEFNDICSVYEQTMRTAIAEKLIKNGEFKAFFKQKTGVELTTSKIVQSDVVINQNVLTPDVEERHSRENEVPNPPYNRYYYDHYVSIGYKDNRTTFFNKNKGKKGAIIYTEESEEKTLQLSCSIIEDNIISEKIDKCNTVLLVRDNDFINRVISNFEKKEKSNSDNADGR